jgi:uroporphyrinogen decarboxylase
MIEGKGSKTFSEAKRFLYTQPRLAHRLLEKITGSTINYLKAQIEAGADLVQLFDSWAGMLSPRHYKEFALQYISQICEAISTVPVTVFAKGAFFARKEFSKSSCSVIGLDWTMDAEESKRLCGSKALQGNMDPCLLYGSEEVIHSETTAMLKQFGTKGYIANLGHGLYPDTPKEKVKFFVDTVKNYRHDGQ